MTSPFASLPSTRYTTPGGLFFSPPTVKEIQQICKAQREGLHLTQVMLGDITGLKRDPIKKLETGRYKEAVAQAFWKVIKRAMDNYQPPPREYSAEVRATIETADIVIEVLDARDPLGSRSKVMEQKVINAGKPLILIVNKIDLVPKENVRVWLEFLRDLYPTIAFKASTQEQNSKLGPFGGSKPSNSSSAKCIGADSIFKLLGNYCRNKDIKTSIRVGRVGFPNVGKSSVINSLMEKRACSVGAKPGVTKQVQEVELDKNIRLLDSPGLVFLPKLELDTHEVALRKAIQVEKFSDPVVAVGAILRRCSKETLMLHYTDDEFDSCDKFLALVARKLKKGGVADVDAAARHVLQDWKRGRLRYYTQPPKQPALHETSGAAEIVQQFSKEFDMASLDPDIAKLIDALPMETSSDVATAVDGGPQLKRGEQQQPDQPVKKPKLDMKDHGENFTLR
ncbi:unnamed protein product, partial [Mesorhabditis spiculigera]